MIADEPDQLLRVAQMLRDRRDRAAALIAEPGEDTDRWGWNPLRDHTCDTWSTSSTTSPNAESG